MILLSVSHSFEDDFLAVRWNKCMYSYKEKSVAMYYVFNARRRRCTLADASSMAIASAMNTVHEVLRKTPPASYGSKVCASDLQSPTIQLAAAQSSSRRPPSVCTMIFDWAGVKVVVYVCCQEVRLSIVKSARPSATLLWHLGIHTTGSLHLWGGGGD